MGGYKISYKVLDEQGEALKKISKELDQYVSQLNAVKGKLGSDEMLADIRHNLGKLSTDMEETKTILQMAGEFLTQSVRSYTDTEKKVIKASGNTKAHKRDFYKNPVTVVSGSAAATATATAAATAAVNVTVNTEPAATTAAKGSFTSSIKQGGSKGAAGVAAAVSKETQSAAGAAKTVKASQMSGVGAAVAAAAGGVVAGAAAGAVGMASFMKSKDASLQSDATTMPADATIHQPEDDLELIELQRKLESARRDIKEAEQAIQQEIDIGE